MKTVELKTFAGVRNDVSPERFNASDLTACVNVELDETGKPSRRLGTTAVDGAPAHSLWADDGWCLLVRNTTLQRMFSPTVFHDYGVSIAGARVCYARINNDVFFSDGVQSGVVNVSGEARRWGIATPAEPTITLVAGGMAVGAYLVTTTYARAHGAEGGSSATQVVDVPVGKGLHLTFTPPTDPTLTHRHVYVSEVDGEVPLLTAVISALDNECTLSALPATRTLAVRTGSCGTAPAGQVIGVFKGRVFIAENNYLWYSEPYEYELFRLATNHIGFASRVRTFSPVADGFFVGTDDETVFVSGSNPKDFESKRVAPYGTLLGSETTIPNKYFGKGTEVGPVPAWMSKQGLCVGTNGGQLTNLTGSRYELPAGVSQGASLLKVRGGTPQLITSIFS